MHLTYVLEIYTHSTHFFVRKKLLTFITTLSTPLPHQAVMNLLFHRCSRCDTVPWRYSPLRRFYRWYLTAGPAGRTPLRVPYYVQPVTHAPALFARLARMTRLSVDGSSPLAFNAHCASRLCLLCSTFACLLPRNLLLIRAACWPVQITCHFLTSAFSARDITLIYRLLPLAFRARTRWRNAALCSSCCSPRRRAPLLYACPHAALQLCWRVLRLAPRTCLASLPHGNILCFTHAPAFATPLRTAARAALRMRLVRMVLTILIYLFVVVSSARRYIVTNCCVNGHRYGCAPSRVGLARVVPVLFTPPTATT